MSPTTPPHEDPSASDAVHDRLRREGPDALPDEDLLLALLAGPRRREDDGRAARLLTTFGSLRRLACASPGELLAAGATPGGALRLAAAFALGRRTASERRPARPLLRTSVEIFERFHPILRDARRERFVVVLLDAKNRVLREETVSEGGLTSAPVHPREVFSLAIREAARGVVLVHNHPSGDPEPSPEDVDVTRRLVAVGELVGIPVLDHVVVGDGAFVSFLERGWV